MTNNCKIDEETILQLGLLQVDPLSANPGICTGRTFAYPNLENVYIMECDLYGNDIPADHCFLAFNGHHGLMGKNIKLDKLKQSGKEDIQEMVHSNEEG